MATTLYSDEIKSVDAAAEKFSSEKGLVLLRPHRACCKAFYFTIPSGCYALVSRHGADEEYVRPDGTKSIVWPPGLHFPHPPWVRVSNLVTQQAIVLDLPVKACKTKDNVTVNIDVALAFRIMGDEELGEDPDLVRRFVHELKPRGLEQQLRDAQDEAVRALARSLMHTEIYGIRSGENLRHIQTSSVMPTGVGVVGGVGNSASLAAGACGVAGAALDAVGEEKTTEDGHSEEGHHRDDSASTTESQSSAGILGATPIAVTAPIIHAPIVPTHRDETLVGRSDPEDRDAASAAASAGADVTDYMKQRLNRQFKPQGVEILSIMIESCRLPHDIESQMEEKTKVISKNAAQRMHHQNTMQNTRMEEEVVTLLQRFEEKKLQEESAGIEKINEERVRLDDAMAEARKSEASIREEARARIQKLRAENGLAVQRIVSRKEENIARTRAEADKEAAQLHAATELEVGRKLAEASLTAEKNRADASRVLHAAEGTIAPHIAKKNAHLTELKRIDVHRSLAKCRNLILGDAGEEDDGDNGDFANLVAAADAILADPGRSEASRTMARMALLRGAIAATGGTKTPTQDDRDNRTSGDGDRLVNSRGLLDENGGALVEREPDDSVIVTRTLMDVGAE